MVTKEIYKQIHIFITVYQTGEAYNFLNSEESSEYIQVPNKR